VEPKDRVQLAIDAMQRELPAFDYSAKAIAARLVRLGVLFVQAIERAVAPFGLSPNEYVILCVLRAGGPPYTLPPKAINPLMNLSSGGMTNILHALARRGLIERLPDPSDRRGVLIKITPKAKNLVESAIAAHVAEEHRMIAVLSKQERNSLQSLLGKLLLGIDPVRQPVTVLRDSGANRRVRQQRLSKPPPRRPRRRTGS
jgi:DNA-binding MarR family transcriptional regulator